MTGARRWDSTPSRAELLRKTYDAFVRSGALLDAADRKPG